MQCLRPANTRPGSVRMSEWARIPPLPPRRSSAAPVSRLPALPPSSSLQNDKKVILFNKSLIAVSSILRYSLYRRIYPETQRCERTAKTQEDDTYGKMAESLYQPNLPLGSKKVTGSAEHIALSRKTAGEGMVLLKNETGLLRWRKEQGLLCLAKERLTMSKAAAEAAM